MKDTHAELTAKIEAMQKQLKEQGKLIDQIIKNLNIEIWNNCDNELPKEGQIVNAKSHGHIGKRVVFSNGKFHHRFYSSDKFQNIDIEFKNVTHWQAFK